jgi:cadmium resistance protein CadD (predicted permease)
MSLLKEVIAELIGMFFGDARLTVALLLLVAVAGALIKLTEIEPLIGGIVLILGCPALLIANLRRERRTIAPGRPAA